VKRHPFDPFSFFFGVVFTVVAVGFLSGRFDLADARLSALWAVPAVTLGLLFLLVAARRATDDGPRPVPAPAIPDDEPEPEELEPLP
jgi:hypothetical protein